jgi:hypothetical protein
MPRFYPMRLIPDRGRRRKCAWGQNHDRGVSLGESQGAVMTEVV